MKFHNINGIAMGYERAKWFAVFPQSCGDLSFVSKL
jgi:hypothetical protein